MIRSLFTGVSGLKQEQIKMDVISNNVANVNTTGFKKGRAMFQDLFSQTIRHAQQAFGNYGGLNPLQVGLGVRLGSIDTLMEQGTLEATGKNTDLAIEGNGFFMVKDQNKNPFYTRDGNFNTNPNYDLVSANTGFKLQGWLATQDPKSGNLVLDNTGVPPYDINIVKFLKKYAHQTNNVAYASNLDSGSDERDIKFGLDTLTFKDSEGNFQNLKLKFKKEDAQNWIWTATDDSEGNVATGIIKTDADGKVLSSVVDPAGVGATIGEPFFIYDPDGTPVPASATSFVNSITNGGNGVSSGVLGSGKEVKNESVQVIFDGGDPTRATSYRVVGSERGFIGAGTLGGTQAILQGAQVTFGATWTPANDVAFDIEDQQFVPARSTQLAGPPPTPGIQFTGGVNYTPTDVVNTINAALKSNGVRATASYDSVVRKFTIVSNEVGSNRHLAIANQLGANFDELGLPPSAPKIVSALSIEPGALWYPTQNIDFTISDSNVPANRANIHFDASVAGYSQGDITANLLGSMAGWGAATPGVSFVDTDNNGTANALVLTGPTTGAGQKLIMSGTNSTMTALGFTAGTYSGTSADITGTGGSKPETFSDSNQAFVDPDPIWTPTITTLGAAFENDRWNPTSDVNFTITDRNNKSAAVSFTNLVQGVDHTYTKGEILAEINAKLAQNGVAASAQFVDTNNDARLTPDQLVIVGTKTGVGERITLSGDLTMGELGLISGTYSGTAATSTFNTGGLNFSLTEGANSWVPNDTMSMTTTAEKGQSESVKIYVPQPIADTLSFKTTVNGETFQVTGAVEKGAKHSTSIAIFDSLGAAHQLVTEWEHTNKATMEWTYKISYDKSDPEVQKFLTDPGNGIIDPKNPSQADLDRANDALIKDRKGTIYFTKQGKIDPGKSQIRDVSMTPTGSNPVTVKLNMDLATQFNATFTTAAREQDGYEMGLLESMYFEQDGTVRGVYSNGQKQPIGMVSLATFNNPGGLEKRGKNLYEVSPNSGAAVVGKPMIGERGTLVPGSLEMSNVDIAEEFTNMIITQRAFQANSRVITTSDEILQEVVNLKR